MSTYLELCQKLHNVCGLSGAEPVSVIGRTGMDKMLTTFIADADVKIQRLWEDWEFLRQDITFSTIDGTSEYTQSLLGIEGIMKWRSVFYIDVTTASYSKLVTIDYNEYKKSAKYLGAVEYGKPTCVVISPSNSLILWKTPSATSYSISGEYYKTPTRMVSNTDRSTIPIQFEECIIYLAKMMYAEYDEDIALYKMAQGDYALELMRLESHSLPYNKSKYSHSDTTQIVETI